MHIQTLLDIREEGTLWMSNAQGMAVFWTGRLSVQFPGMLVFAKKLVQHAVNTQIQPRENLQDSLQDTSLQPMLPHLLRACETCVRLLSYFYVVGESRHQISTCLCFSNPWYCPAEFKVALISINRRKIYYLIVN